MAWLGLVPSEHASGAKVERGGITIGLRPIPRRDVGAADRAGNVEIRRLLVLGATAMARRAETWNSAAGLWLRGVLARRPARLATVALANKMARIAWALLTRNEVYRAQGRSKVAAGAAA